MNKIHKLTVCGTKECYMEEKFPFKLWYNPHFFFALGIHTKQQISITWLEEYGLCDLGYCTLPRMFIDVARIRERDTIEGIALTVIDEEFYEMEYKAKYNMEMSKRRRH